MPKENNIQTSPLSILFACIIAHLIMGLSISARAQGNLLITPKRIVFDGQKRTQEINLANTGNDTARYVISFIQIRMKDNGNFEEISKPDSGQQFADKYLRIFPRAVTLGPREAQVVKIQTIGKLIPGEYRSHLYFRSVFKENPLGQAETKADSSKVSVRLRPIFGISIPVIIRSGELAAKVSLSDLRIGNNAELQPILKVRLNREGDKSVYGNLSVVSVSSDGKVNQVGIMKGISVYTPNASRDVELKLNKEAFSLNSGTLRVIYTPAAAEKSKTLAVAELEIN